MSKLSQKDTIARWAKRLFRNRFTYRGEVREVAGWCVKFQWEGRRRTLRLGSPDRLEAARQAMEIHAELRRGGWVSIETRRGAGWGRGSTVRTGPRVGVRKYVSNLHGNFQRELFAEIEFEGVTEQLALGTEDENEARLRAAEFDVEVQQTGWDRVRLSRSREVTVAVFWQANPMTCTYTTLLSLPVAGRVGGLGPVNGLSTRGWRILVLEPDGPVRRALLHWLSQHPAAIQVGGYVGMEAVPVELGWDLVLANRGLVSASLKRWQDGAGGGGGGVRVLPHGLFADSDAIFASVSGVSRGYFLQRLPPARLLEPLLGEFPDGPSKSRGDEERQIRRHFQNVFETVEGSREHSFPEISTRETQVLELLARGWSDKEIANELAISVWTVHSHLKRIFGKFGVRTRTEAVVRHLQK